MVLHGATEETERLLLHVPRLADAEALMGVFGDREAMCSKWANYPSLTRLSFLPC